MKKIVLVGELRSLNLGDSVIFFVFYSLLSKFYSGDIITLDISDYRNSTNWIASLVRKINNHCTSFTNRIAYPYMRLKSLKDIPANSYVCFVGGALFQNYFIDSLIAILDTAKKKNCTLDFFSLGIGPLSQKNQKILQSAINRNRKKIFSIRDGTHFWRKMGIPYIEQSDVATCSSIVYTGKKENRDKVLGIGVISFSIYKQTFPETTLDESVYVQSIRHLVNAAIEKDYKVELFCNGDPSDYNESITIKNSIGKSEVSIAPRPTTHYELVNLIRNYSFVVATRLHALILSYSFCIPFYAIGWDPKVREWLSSIQRNDLGVMLDKIDTISWNDILKTKNLSLTDQERLVSFQNSLIERIKEISQVNL